MKDTTEGDVMAGLAQKCGTWPACKVEDRKSGTVFINEHIFSDVMAIPNNFLSHGSGLANQFCRIPALCGFQNPVQGSEASVAERCDHTFLMESGRKGPEMALSSALPLNSGLCVHRVGINDARRQDGTVGCSVSEK